MSARHLNVKGTVAAMTYPGAGNEPVVTVLLRVGDGASVLLSFLGRTDIHSFHIGSYLHVKGALTDKDGLPTVFNPQFSVLSY